MTKKYDYSKDVTPLVTSIILCEIDVFKKLIAQGSDINQQDDRGLTPLMMAIEEDWTNPEWIDLLLENNANVNLQNKLGETALDMAYYMEREDVIAKLLAKNATRGKMKN